MFALLSAFAAYFERSQVIVDVFTQKMPKKFKGYMMGFFMVGFFALGVVFVWELFESAIDTAEYGKVMQDLRLSMIPIYGFSAFSSVILAMRSFIESNQYFRYG